MSNKTSIKKETVNEVKLSLKLMVDSKAKKVVFAEAGKEFVDFLFHILSLPLSTVVKLLNNEGMTGSLHVLYKSVESLKTEYFEQNVNKDTVLQTKLSITLPLLSLRHVPTTLTLYKCPVHDYISDHKGATCELFSFLCDDPMSEMNLTYVTQTSKNEPTGFVRELVAYMVSDNLDVKPMSMTLVKALVNDFDSLVEQEVQFGLKEGLALLRASMETNDVLTTVFLERRRKQV